MQLDIASQSRFHFPRSIVDWNAALNLLTHDRYARLLRWLAAKGEPAPGRDAMESVSELGKLLIISPHGDDAIFACGEVMASRRGLILVSLFAGLPSPALPLTDWDAAGGFSNTHEAVVQRREEHGRAVELLHATPILLDFLGSQYSDPPGAIGLAETIAAVLDEENPDSVMLPAGLYHADHILTHQAALMARTRDPQRQWLLYEDSFYRRMPTLLQQRLTGLVHFGIEATPVAFDTHAQAERKRHAVQCYASQLRALAAPGRPGHSDIFAPEGYWRLSAA
ncbi:PIG-L family deacetylase [Janthinobacterium sp. 17J80-10]|uniref:PIG-L deacetylase family protein n=1 Tax=Janthinobacterium sp. 17J80-10 TaxID=2497863 RepID=UPI0010053C7D|nr:PIG-L family deacetylase [Janthinobacterium sp. 17J80-10]QAU34031.1 PIG-L family deacetylase [Janthinobacterium sp. 17J80-10]